MSLAGADHASPPRVDVVIPTRDRPELTAEAVASVLTQTHTELRLFVVDDASTPGSRARLAELLPDDDRLEVVTLSENVGEGAARQAGFERGDAPFVAVLDSDDLWLPEKLERQLARFHERRAALPRLGAVLTAYSWRRPDGSVRVEHRIRHEGRTRPMACSNMSAILVTREAVDAAGGFLADDTFEGATGQHLDFSIRLSTVCDVTSVDEMLVTCRDHDGPRVSNEAKSWVGIEAFEHVLDVRREALEPFPEDHAAFLARTAARCFEVGAIGRGSRHLWHALRIAPPAQKARVLRRYGPFAVKQALRSLLRRPTPR